MKTNANPNLKVLKGQYIRCTYEGLPLEFEEWNDLFVVGNIPPDIWDEIRKKQEEFMKDPDWEVEDLFNITVDTLTAAGCKVYSFCGSDKFPALLPDDIPNPADDPDIILCDWCRCEIPYDDRIIMSEATDDARFCTESDLYEALMQSIDDEVKIVESDDGNGDDLLECPHCHEKSRGTSDRWGSEGPYIVSGIDGFAFSILTCPCCGKSAPMTEAIMVDINDPRLQEDSIEAAERIRQEQKFSPPREDE